MKKFEILRYVKKFSILILVFAILGSAAIYMYGKRNQQYTASATIRYTNEGMKDGCTPDGSKLNVDEIYSTTVISQAMEPLGLTGTPDIIRSRCAVTPIIPEEQQKLNDALLDDGEEVTYFPDTYKIQLVVNGDMGEAYARNVLDSIIESYFRIYTEKYVEQKLSLNPSEKLLKNGYDYYQCVYMLDDDTKSMLDFLAAKKETFPEFRSSVTGYTFSDLYEIYNELNTYKIPSLYAQVLNGPQVKNAEYLKKALADEIKKSQNGELVRIEQRDHLKFLIDNFSTKNKDILDYHYKGQIDQTSETDYILKDVEEHHLNMSTETTYDSLILEYVNLDKAIKKEAIRRNDKQFFLDVFGGIAQQSSGDEASHKAMEEAINSYEKSLVKYYALVNDTSKELNRYLSADFLRMENSVTVTQAINIKRYVALAILFFLIVGVLGAIVLGRASDIIEYFLYIDKKTGLPNRERCDAFIAERAKTMVTDNYSCFVFRFDNLVELTKKYGYNVGDNVLKDFAGLLRACIPEPGSVFHNNKGVFLGFMDQCSATKANATLDVLAEHIAEYNNLNPDYAIEYKGVYATSTEEEKYSVRDLISIAFKKASEN